MMKRLLSAFLCALLIMSLSGCKEQPVEDGYVITSSITETAETSATDVTLSNDETTKSDDITVAESKPETAEESNSTSETNSTPTEKETTEKAETPTQKVEETKPQTKPTETQPVKQPEETTSETPTIPTTEPSTGTTSQKTESTTEPETQAPEQTEPPKAFDIDYWVDYAKTYAKSKGLVLDATAIDCWDNPIRAGAHCIYLERDIQSRLNRYANDEDITDVWIWIESVGNDCYDIYIGYA